MCFITQNQIETIIEQLKLSVPVQNIPTQNFCQYLTQLFNFSDKLHGFVFTKVLGAGVFGVCLSIQKNNEEYAIKFNFPNDDKNENENESENESDSDDSGSSKISNDSNAITIEEEAKRAKIFSDFELGPHFFGLGEFKVGDISLPGIIFEKLDMSLNQYFKCLAYNLNYQKKENFEPTQQQNENKLNNIKWAGILLMALFDRLSGLILDIHSSNVMIKFNLQSKDGAGQDFVVIDFGQITFNYTEDIRTVFMFKFSIEGLGKLSENSNEMKEINIFLTLFSEFCERFSEKNIIQEILKI